MRPPAPRKPLPPQQRAPVRTATPVSSIGPFGPSGTLSSVTDSSSLTDSLSSSIVKKAPAVDNTMISPPPQKLPLGEHVHNGAQLRLPQIPMRNRVDDKQLQEQLLWQQEHYDNSSRQMFANTNRDLAKSKQAALSQADVDRFVSPVARPARKPKRESRIQFECSPTIRDAQIQQENWTNLLRQKPAPSDPVGMSIWLREVLEVSENSQSELSAQLRNQRIAELKRSLAWELVLSRRPSSDKTTLMEAWILEVISISDSQRQPALKPALQDPKSDKSASSSNPTDSSGPTDASGSAGSSRTDGSSANDMSSSEGASRGREDVQDSLEEDDSSDSVTSSEGAPASNHSGSSSGGSGEAAAAAAAAAETATTESESTGDEDQGLFRGGEGSISFDRNSSQFPQKRPHSSSYKDKNDHPTPSPKKFKTDTQSDESSE